MERYAMAVKESFKFLDFGEQVTVCQPLPVSLRRRRGSIDTRYLYLGAIRARTLLVTFNLAPGTAHTRIASRERHRSSWFMALKVLQTLMLRGVD